MSSGLLTDIIGLVLVGIGLISHLFLPQFSFPIVGNRAMQVALVDMDNLTVDQEEVKRILDEGGKNVAESEDAVG